MASRSTTRGFWLPHIHHMFHLTIELKDLQRRCPCGVNRAISKNSSLDMRAARRLHRVSGRKTSAPIDHWGTDGSPPFQALVQPVGGTRARRCRNVCATHIHVGNAQRTHQEPSSVDEDIITTSGMASGQPRCHAASSTPSQSLDVHFRLSLIHI